MKINQRVRSKIKCFRFLKMFFTGPNEKEFLDQLRMLNGNTNCADCGAIGKVNVYVLKIFIYFWFI